MIYLHPASICPVSLQAAFAETFPKFPSPKSRVSLIDYGAALSPFTSQILRPCGFDMSDHWAGVFSLKNNYAVSTESSS